MTKPAELILHIGHYKSGTTALQVFCTSNAAALERQGLHYAQYPLKMLKHSGLAYSVLRDAGVETMLYDFKAEENAVQMWSKVFDAVRALDPGQSLLVSSEEFMRIGAHPAATEVLREVFAGAPDIPVRVIAYVRAPHDHLRSWYNQLIKLGISVGNFETAVRSEIEVIHWDYARALEPWLSVFGEERVIVRQFQDDLREGDGLYADFLEALGFGLPITAKVPERDPNPRMDDRILDLKRAFIRANLTKPVINQAVERALENLAAEDGAGGLADAPTFEEIRSTSKAGIDALSALPNTNLNPEKMLSHLPRPLSEDARQMGDLVTLLAGEMANMRNHQQRLNRRLTALENSIETAPGGKKGKR